MILPLAVRPEIYAVIEVPVAGVDFKVYVVGVVVSAILNPVKVALDVVRLKEPVPTLVSVSSNSLGMLPSSRHILTPLAAIFTTDVPVTTSPVTVSVPEVVFSVKDDTALFAVEIVTYLSDGLIPSPTTVDPAATAVRAFLAPRNCGRRPVPTQCFAVNRVYLLIYTENCMFSSIIKQKKTRSKYFLNVSLICWIYTVSCIAFT